MVMTIESIRSWNTRALADSFGGVKGFSERIARAQPQVSHIIGRSFLPD